MVRNYEEKKTNVFPTSPSSMAQLHSFQCIDFQRIETLRINSDMQLDLIKTSLNACFPHADKKKSL